MQITGQTITRGGQRYTIIDAGLVGHDNTTTVFGENPRGDEVQFFVTLDAAGRITRHATRHGGWRDADTSTSAR